MSRRYTDSERTELSANVLALMPTMSMAKACRTSGIAHSTVIGWIGSDEQLAEATARAKEDYREYLAEKIMALAAEPYPTDERGRTDNGAVQARRVEIDTYKWMLSKQHPKHYGDRVTLAGDADAPLNNVVKVTHEIVNRQAIEDKVNDDE